MALLQSSHGVLSRSYGVLVGDALRTYDAFNAFHGARNACTALSQRPQCADGVLKTQCRDFPAFPKFWPGAC